MNHPAQYRYFRINISINWNKASYIVIAGRRNCKNMMKLKKRCILFQAVLVQCRCIWSKRETASRLSCFVKSTEYRMWFVHQTMNGLNYSHFTCHIRLLLCNICVLIFTRSAWYIRADSVDNLNHLETERFHFISVLNLSKLKTSADIRQSAF